MGDKTLITLDEWRARQALARDGGGVFEPEESGARDRVGRLAGRGAAWGALWGAVVGGLAVVVALAVRWGWL